MQAWMNELPRLSELDGDSKNPMLLAVVTDANLILSEKGRVLEVHIEKDPYIVTSGKHRRLINQCSPRSTLQWVMMDAVQKKQQIKPGDSCGYSVASEQEPLLAFGAGVLPIVVMGARKYPLAFLREINPIGFNTASGLTDSFLEVKDPSSVIFREFYEELLVMSADRKRVYECRNQVLTDVAHRPYWEANTKLWNLKPEDIIPTYVSAYPMASKEAIHIYYDGVLVNKLENIAISIPPTMGEINGIMPVRIHIPDGEEKMLSDLAVFDSEVHWKYPDIPLNRTVVAFDMDCLMPGKKPPIVATWSCGLNPNQLSLGSTIVDTLAALRP